MLTASITACLMFPGLRKVSNAFDHIYSDSSSDMNKYKNILHNNNTEISLARPRT